MGSIPPAASIEYPQREIVAAIAGCGLTPDNGDLGQLLKALKLADVQNVLKMGTNQGTASQWSMTCPTLPTMPPPVGTALWFKPNAPSQNGGTVFSVNGSAFLPVVCCDLTPIAIGDILPTAWLLLYNDGAHWQVVVGSTRQFGAMPILTQNTDWYVNASTGNDSYDGSLAAPAGGTRGPFKTLQRAANEVVRYNQNGFNQYVHVADGAYAAFVALQTNGSGQVVFIGNEGAPENCTVTGSAANQSAILQAGGSYVFKGFRPSATVGSCDGFANNGGKTTLTNMRFGICTRFHISAGFGGTVQLLGGTFTIEAGATTSAHVAASLAGQVVVDQVVLPALNILGAVNVGRFVDAEQLGVCNLFYSAIAGKANAHGFQYAASGNGVVSSLGGGPTYFPGDLGPGPLTTGGQYIP